MDNSQYKFGLDFYEGNSVRNWSVLDAWSEDPQFAYFRMGIGLHKDRLDLLNACRAQTVWQLGGYYELWLADEAKADQIKTFSDQMTLVADKLTLPPALAFEQQTEIDKHGKKVTAWPSVGDLEFMVEALQGSIVYTSLAGLNEIKRVLGKVPSSWKFWLAWYAARSDQEAIVDDGLAYLLKTYGISKDQILFWQTSETGAYPAGASYDKSADYNRAVSYVFPGTVPPPVVVPPVVAPPVVIPPVVVPPPSLVTGTVTATSGLHVRATPSLTGAVVGALQYNTKVQVEVQGDWSKLYNNALQGYVSTQYLSFLPEPSGAALYYLKRRDQLPNSNPWNGSFAQIGGRSQSNFVRIAAPEIQLILSARDNSQLARWAFSDGGTLYIKYNQAQASALWPIVLMSSTPTDLQRVRVLELKQGFAHIDAIPYNDHGDYSSYTPDRHPEFWLNCWAGFKSGSYGPSHAGLVFLMPLFAPETFPNGSGPLKPAPGLWVDQGVLAEKV